MAVGTVMGAARGEARGAGGVTGDSARDGGRRRFLAGLLGGIGAGIFAEAAGILAAYLAPEPGAGRGKRIECGRADSYTVGEVRWFPEGRLFVVRREDGFLALSQRCTHLACLVPWDEGRGVFRCPCHGGTYDKDGVVLHGPPPRPLDLVSLQIANGALVADTGEITRRKGMAPDQVVRA